VSDRDHEDGQHTVIHLVDDPVVADSDAETISALEGLAPGRTRIVRQGCYRVDDSRADAAVVRPAPTRRRRR
jgi:hypothetical protein